MNRVIYLSKLVFSVCFLVLCISAPSIAHAATEKFELALPARSGMVINLVHSFGNLEVRQGIGTQVKITGSKLAESDNPEIAQEFLDNIELDINNGPNQLDITTVYPNIGFSLFKRNKVTNRGMSYVIEVPADARLNIGLRFGNIELNRFSGGLKIQARQSIIQARELVGDVNISNVYGSIAIELISGNVVIVSDQGAVSAVGITGDLDLANKFGSTEIRDVEGDVRSSGEITPMHIEAVRGEVEVNSSDSTIDLIDIEESVVVRARRSHVTVEDVKGDVQITNREGVIDIERVGGNIDVESILGPLTIRNANQDIVVRGRSSNLLLEEVMLVPSAAPRRIDLTTSLGFLKMNLPANLSATLQATTRREQIHANFPVILNDSDDESLSISADFGDGKDFITLTGTENVEITLIKN
ncbi:MAG: hypothetical protein COB20_06765 [SAR86 cluster bacterium]|uniref:Adhesin domain-containing protein n=1 Tax=SAR86 cluster bacterium TaxID=2030880 RepID=A0A2A4X8E4_9GAMM|nr:MAG: hypothetical protein COB20_06765 [SAR86 cluster bacterium]